VCTALRRYVATSIGASGGSLLTRILATEPRSGLRSRRQFRAGELLSPARRIVPW
jgi:hypothetical protein